jgi:hypothetical protein
VQPHPRAQGIGKVHKGQRGYVDRLEQQADQARPEQIRIQAAMTEEILETTITNHVIDEDGAMKINILYRLGWFTVNGFSYNGDDKVMMRVKGDSAAAHEESILVPLEDWNELNNAWQDHIRAGIRDNLFAKLDPETMQRHRDESIRTDKLLGIYDREHGEEST